jgi:hypothetical protein
VFLVGCEWPTMIPQGVQLQAESLGQRVCDTATAYCNKQVSGAGLSALQAAGVAPYSAYHVLVQPFNAGRGLHSFCLPQPDPEYHPNPHSHLQMINNCAQY